MGDGIYKTKSPYGSSGHAHEDIFVTSLSFEMEPGQYGEEDASPRNMTQIPIEGLLDEFGVFVTDFYEDLNEVSEGICYQEFGAFQLEDIQNLRTVIGKRFYAAPYADENSGAKSYNLVLESAASHFSGGQQSQPGSQWQEKRRR